MQCATQGQVNKVNLLVHYLSPTEQLTINNSLGQPPSYDFPLVKQKQNNVQIVH